MKIYWIGHSSFLIEDSLGRRILTDPYNSYIGLEPFDDQVNIVTISHDHIDHNNKSFLSGKEAVVSSPGFYDLSFARINGFKSYHDNCRGLKRGENTIFLIELEGYRLCHLGDLGHPLDEELLLKLTDIDVLFIPVGGHFTLDGNTAGELCRRINSKIIIPMHYKTPKILIPLDGPESFILSMKNATKIDEAYISIKERPQEINKVIIFKDYSKTIK
ncbi:MBL fold metallo-hydrolase [Alloiococcus sp. CFN-8]|uniref:MBL fold metallo-hydrolase n=1 Tax=Alloiococcus sp. CFN-8 TaxID=3416081 RepID=UPI003CED2C39